MVFIQEIEGIVDSEQVLKVRRFKAQVRGVLERAKAIQQSGEAKGLEYQSLQEDCKKAEQFLQQWPELDDLIPTEDYVQLSEQRRDAGLPWVAPSEVKVLVYQCLRATRANYAAKLDSDKEYWKSLPIYQRLLEQSVAMREELWEDGAEVRLSLNNLAVCARRCGVPQHAMEWFKNALQLCRYEAPEGCEEQAIIRHNFESFLTGDLAGPPRVGITAPGGQEACWNCGKEGTPHNHDHHDHHHEGCNHDHNKDDDSGVKLMKCSKCIEGGYLCLIARYCSKECQTNDWKQRHRKYHKAMQPIVDIMADPKPKKVPINTQGLSTDGAADGTASIKQNRPVDSKDFVVGKTVKGDQLEQYLEKKEYRRD